MTAINYNDPALHQAVKPFLRILASCDRLKPEESIKTQYHLRGRLLLEAIAADLGYNSEQYEVRSNKAGPAVWGEITLHANDLYVQFCLGCIVDGLEILHRWCKGQQDYRGGPNHWLRFSALKDYETVLHRFERTRASGHTQEG